MATGWRMLRCQPTIRLQNQMGTERQQSDGPDPLLDTLCAAVESKLQHYARVRLPTLCDEIGLPHAQNNEDLTKRDYIASRLAKLSQENQTKIRDVAAKFVSQYSLGEYGNDATYGIEELLWQAREPKVSVRVRRELASALDGFELFTDPEGFLNVLEKLFVLDPDGISLLHEHKSLHWKIRQHLIRNPEDWTVTDFFKEIGALKCSSERFRRMIEALAGPEARPDEASQRLFVETANSALAAHSFELVETGKVEGYPSFSFVRSSDAKRGRPKNLIFGSVVKPDLRFRDAVDNEIEIVNGEEHVLVYDEPIGGALLWRDLQSWWARREGIEESERAKRTLYKRLLSCLPDSSPPQGLLFEAFFEHFQAGVPDLPALLPEVWLYYDPKTVRERGKEALFRQRMDYLMLLRAGVRVVLEVDGRHHYSSNGRPAPRRYAELVKADRELKLCGYEVYRFGASELEGNAGRRLVGSFFDNLFRKHGIG